MIHQPNKDRTTTPPKSWRSVKTFESFMLAKGYARSTGFKFWQKDGITITSDEVQALFDEYLTTNTK